MIIPFSQPQRVPALQVPSLSLPPSCSFLHFLLQGPPSPSFPFPSVPNNFCSQLSSFVKSTVWPSPPMCIFCSVCVFMSIKKTTTIIAIIAMSKVQKRQQMRA